MPTTTARPDRRPPGPALAATLLCLLSAAARAAPPEVAVPLTGNIVTVGGMQLQLMEHRLQGGATADVFLVDGQTGGIAWHEDWLVRDPDGNGPPQDDAAVLHGRRRLRLHVGHGPGDRYSLFVMPDPEPPATPPLPGTHASFTLGTDDDLYLLAGPSHRVRVLIVPEDQAGPPGSLTVTWYDEAGTGSERRETLAAGDRRMFGSFAVAVREARAASPASPARLTFDVLSGPPDARP